MEVLRSKQRAVQRRKKRTCGRNMPRYRTALIHHYFCEENGKSVCMIEDDIGTSCSAVISTHATALERHVSGRHADEYKRYLKRKAETSFSSESDSSTCKHKQSRMSNFGFVETHRMVNPKITYKEFELACIELVTIDGRPFTAVEDCGFRRITEPLLRSVDAKDKKYKTMNRFKLRKLVVKKSGEIREKIKSLVQQKLISLKIDGATRNLRSFLGVNIQFYSGNVLVICTLGVIELKTSHSAENLKNEVINILKEFGVDHDQIYSVTTDNGSNYVSCVEKLDWNIKIDGQCVLDEHLNEIPPQSKNVYSDDDDWDLDEIVIEEEERDVDGTSESGTYEDDLKNILEGLESTQWSTLHKNVVGVRCGAHTGNLAAEDAIHRWSEDGTFDIQRIRQVVKGLRTESALRELRHQRKLLPILDCKTRWTSMYNMLERLCVLKSYVNEAAKYNTTLKIEEHQWNDIHALVDVLKPFKIMMVKAQAPDMCINDFFILWKKTMFELSKKKLPDGTDHLLAVLLLKFMAKRETLLMDNAAFVAGIFLNPTWKHVIPKHMIPNIIEYLCTLKRQNRPSCDKV